MKHGKGGYLPLVLLSCLTILAFFSLEHALAKKSITRYHSKYRPAPLNQFNAKQQALIKEHLLKANEPSWKLSKRMMTVAQWALTISAKNQKTPSMIALKDYMQTRGLVIEHVIPTYVSGARDFQELLSLLKTAFSKHYRNKAPLVAGMAFKRDKRSYRGTLVAGAHEIDISPIPRFIPLKHQRPFQWKFLQDYVQPSLILLGPTGQKKDMPLQALAYNKYQSSLEAFAGRGIYRLEILGNCQYGTVVLMNIPLYWGIRPNQVQHKPFHAASPQKGKDNKILLFQLINRARKKYKLTPLQYNSKLEQAAYAHALDMANEGKIFHINPKNQQSPGKRLQAHGIAYQEMAENIAQGQNIEEIHYFLMASPAHRAAILNPQLTEVGIGISTVVDQDGNKQLYVAQEFARF